MPPHKKPKAFFCRSPVKVFEKIEELSSLPSNELYGHCFTFLGSGLSECYTVVDGCCSVCDIRMRVEQYRGKLGIFLPFRAPRKCDSRSLPDRMKFSGSTRCLGSFKHVRTELEQFDKGCHNFQISGGKGDKPGTVEFDLGDLDLSIWVERLYCIRCRRYKAVIRDQYYGGAHHFSELEITSTSNTSYPCCSSSEVVPVKKKPRISNSIKNLIVDLKTGATGGRPFKSNVALVDELRFRFPLIDGVINEKKIVNTVRRHEREPVSLRNLQSLEGILKSEHPEMSDLVLRSSLVAPAPPNTFQISPIVDALDIDFMRLLHEGGFVIKEITVFTFITSWRLLGSLRDSKSLSISIDFVHGLAKSGVGVYVFTTQDSRRKFFLLGLCAARGETAAGYLFGLLCLKHYCRQGNISLTVQQVISDGFARVKLEFIASSLFGASKRLCYFHASKKAKENVGRSIQPVLTAFGDLVSIFLPEEVFLKIVAFFKSWSRRKVEYLGLGRQKWEDWMEQNLPPGDFSDFCASQDPVLLGRATVPPFEALGMRVVAESVHSGLRQITDEIFCKASDDLTVVRGLVISSIGYTSKKVLEDSPQWRRLPTKQEWAGRGRLADGTLFHFKEFWVCVFPKSGGSKDRSLDEIEELVTQDYQFHFADIWRGFFGLNKHLDFIIADSSTHSPGLPYNIFRLLRNRTDLVLCMASNVWGTLRCSCSAFKSSCGCSHILKFCDMISFNPFPLDQPLQRRTPEKKRLLTEKRKKILPVTPVKLKGSNQQIGCRPADFLTAGEKTSSPPCSSSVLPTPPLYEASPAIPSSPPSGPSPTIPLASSQESSLRFTSSECPSLKKCQDAGIIIENQALARRIWEFHEMLQAMKVKYRVTRDVPGDGNCLYHAVIRRIQEQRPWMPPQLLTPELMREETAKALKRNDVQRAICGFMRIKGNPGEEGFDKEYEAYVSGVSGSRWADYIMITILAKLYGVVITVVDDNGCFSEINPQSELAPCVNILEAIMRANEGASPQYVMAEVGNISRLHFVLIAKDEVEEETDFGRGKRKPKKKMKYGFDA